MRVRFIAVVAGLALATVACSSASKSEASAGGSSGKDAGDSTPIKIAALVYETGPLARKGQQDSLRMAVKEVNDAGGAAGHKLELKLYDLGELTPQNGRAAAQKALSDDPTVMIGPQVTAQTNALQDLVEEAQVPMISLTGDIDGGPEGKNGNKWMFQLQIRDDRDAEAIARTTAGLEPKPKTVVLEYSTDEHTKSMAKHFVKPDLQKHGIKVVAQRKYDPDATNLTAQALATAKADAVVATGYPQPVSLLIKSMRSHGVDIPLVTDYGGESIVLGHLASGSDLRRTYFPGACEPLAYQSVSPVAKKFVSTFHAKYPNSYMYGNAYDATKIIAEAVENAKSVKPSAIRRALTKIKGHDGVCGVETADKGQNFFHSMTIVKMAGGKVSYGGEIKGLTGAPPQSFLDK
jgi:branched-chain amino acid transport system substrate-binding protein